MRRNWIAGAVGLPIGAVVLAIQMSTMPETANQPFGMVVFGTALGAVIYGYMFWACFWGFPKVWSWWRSFAAKIYRLFERVEFNALVTALLIVLGLCALAPALAGVLVYFYSLFWVGFFYSFFGGGVYQFLQTRKVAKGNALEVDSRA